jgi:DNA-directed RNA polymerase subunit RPC12/RpoP
MTPLDWDEIKNTTLECLRCHHIFKGEEMIFRDKLACPNCGYKALKKIKPPRVKRLKAM